MLMNFGDGPRVGEVAITKSLPGSHCPSVVEALVPVVEAAAEVESRAEGAAGSAQDDHLHVAVGDRARRPPPRARRASAGRSCSAVGPVQRDRRDRAVCRRRAASRSSPFLLRVAAGRRTIAAPTREVRTGWRRLQDRGEQAGEASVEVVAPQRVEARGSFLPLTDHARFPQHLEVVRAGRLRDRHVEASAGASLAVARRPARPRSSGAPDR